MLIIIDHAVNWKRPVRLEDVLVPFALAVMAPSKVCPLPTM